jgi:hypothetical protein
MIRAFGAHCHIRTHAVQQKRSLSPPLVIYLVGNVEQRRRNFEAKHLGGCHIQRELRKRLAGV